MLPATPVAVQTSTAVNATGNFGMACRLVMHDMRVSCDSAHSPDHLCGVHDAALLLQPLHVWLACRDSSCCHEGCPSQLRALQANGLLHQIPAIKLVEAFCVSPWQGWFSAQAQLWPHELTTRKQPRGARSTTCKTIPGLQHHRPSLGSSPLQEEASKRVCHHYRGCWQGLNHTSKVL